MLEKLDKWHKTSAGYAVFGLVELGLSYLFASMAIDSGSLLQYAVTLILFIGFAQNLAQLAISKWRRTMH